jgi:hypothetical protein
MRQFIQTFKDFSSSKKSGPFAVDQALDAL